MSNNNYSFQSFSSFSSFSSNGDNKTSEGKGFYVQDQNGKRTGEVYYQKTTPEGNNRYSRQLDAKELGDFIQTPRTIEELTSRFNSFATDDYFDDRSSLTFPRLIDKTFKRRLR